MVKHGLYLVAFLGCLIILSGCSIDDGSDCGSLGPSRTVVFYMGGDNNLSSELSQKLSSLQRYATSSERVGRGEVNLLIYQDGPSEARLYRASFGGSTPVFVGEYGKEDSATAEVFGRVLRDCIRIAPADSYGLVVFSHASGWLPAATLNNPRGASRSIIVDGTTEMDIKDFAAAIPAQSFDYVIFEACYMAGVEVAYELRNKVQYIVASSAEILSPGFTDIYPQMLTKLCCPQVNTETSLCNAAKVYFDHYDKQTGPNHSATVSVIRTSGLGALARLCRRVAPQLVGADPERVQRFDRNAAGRHLFFDLGDYVTQYAPDAVVELESVLAETVLYRAATPGFLLSQGGFTIGAHCGLSIYIPQEHFPYVNDMHQQLQWSVVLKDTHIENVEAYLASRTQST